MISFLLSILALILGYYLYGGFIERIFGVNPESETPALRLSDGVDFVPLPTWKIFLIQFLNIAGLGPIFGAIAGAMYASPGRPPPVRGPCWNITWAWSWKGLRNCSPFRGTSRRTPISRKGALPMALPRPTSTW